MGTTVENQRFAVKRIPYLLDIPCRVRFLSCKPLLDSVDLAQWINDLHWVIAGGESGGRARPTDPGWVRGLREQCVAGRVAFHFKEWGSWWPKEVADEETAVSFVRMTKKRARRTLDGRAGMSFRMASSQIDVFDAHPPGELTKPKLQKSERALWTAEKAALIDEYIHLFLLITKHGVYLDLFAGPQRVDDTESWSVRRVLERRTEVNPAIRHYAVCDKDPAQAKRLHDLGSHHPSFRVYAVDVNEEIRTILKEAPIGSNTACFCLMDQRTFECHWTTVEAVAQHKAGGRKIELFGG